jgi:hypothetical protein
MPSAPRSARKALAASCGALLATAACSDLLGLAPKEEAPPADASVSPDAVAADDATTAPADDAARPDGGAGGGDGGAGRDAARADGASGDAGNPDPDSGCSEMGPVPDGAPRTFYGSCVPHVTPTAVICNQYGYTGSLGVTPQTVAAQKTICTTNLKGTWVDGPCDKDAAVFGCESLDKSGYVCETVALTWYFPPSTVADEEAGCPATIGTIVAP